METTPHSDSLPSIPKDEHQKNDKVTDDGPRESSTPEPSPEEEHNKKTINEHKRTASNASEGRGDLHRENDSNSSVDSSWSKLSDEELKQNTEKKSSLGKCCSEFIRPFIHSFILILC